MSHEDTCYSEHTCLCSVTCNRWLSAPQSLRRGLPRESARKMGAWLSRLAATPPLPRRLEPEPGVAQCNYEARPRPHAPHSPPLSAHLPLRSCCALSTVGWTRAACSTPSAPARCSARCGTSRPVCCSGSTMSTSTCSHAKPASCCGSCRHAVHLERSAPNELQPARGAARHTLHATRPSARTIPSSAVRAAGGLLSYIACHLAQPLL